MRRSSWVKGWKRHLDARHIKRLLDTLGHYGEEICLVRHGNTFDVIIINRNYRLEACKKISRLKREIMENKFMLFSFNGIKIFFNQEGTNLEDYRGKK